MKTLAHTTLRAVAAATLMQDAERKLSRQYVPKFTC